MPDIFTCKPNLHLYGVMLELGRQENLQDIIGNSYKIRYTTERAQFMTRAHIEGLKVEMRRLIIAARFRAKLSSQQEKILKEIMGL